MFTKKLKTKFTVLMAAMLMALQAALPLSVHALSFANIQVTARDTTAGESTVLQVLSGLSAAEEVVFVVRAPDGAILQLPETADLTGAARVEVYGTSLTQTGQYSAAVYQIGTGEVSPITYFNVFSGQTSATKSQLYADRDLLQADGRQVTTVSVKLVDERGNAVVGRGVDLYSSRLEDTINPVNSGLSDDQGIAYFRVSSSKQGQSTLFARDRQGNVTLASRLSLTFQAVSSDLGSNQESWLNTDWLYADILEAAGAVDGFEIEVLEAQLGQVPVGQNLSF